MKKNKKVKRILFASVFGLLVAALIIIPAVLKNEDTAKDNSVVLSTAVESGSITRTVSAAGNLKEQEGTFVELPEGVELVDYLVSNGDYVQKGDPVAQVDNVTTMAKIIALQQEIDSLDVKIQAASSDRFDSYVSAKAYGRVKAIYAGVGDSVQDVIRDKGALAVLSLDGLMAVKIPAGDLRVGTAVTVKTPNGKEYAGRTESAFNGTAVITLTDDGPLLGDTADVWLGGKNLGSGELYVHSAWNVTAVGGEVKDIGTKEEWIVYSGTPIFTLTEVKDTTVYNALLSQRRDYEDTLYDLFRINSTGTITAPCSGCVTGIDKDKIGLLAHRGGAELQLLANEPKEHPEWTINITGAVLDANENFWTVITGESTWVKGNASFDYAKRPVAYAEEILMSMSGLDETAMAEKAVVLPAVLLEGKVYEYNKQTKQLELRTEPFSAKDKNAVLVLVYKDGTEDLNNPDWVVYWQPKKMKIPDFGGFGGFAMPEPEEEFTLTESQLMKIVPQELMTAELVVDEMDILSVSLGQDAEMLIDAIPGHAFTAKVTDISAVGTNSGGHTKYTVTITLPREENMLDGMNATAVLNVGTRENVLTLPSEALAEEGRSTFVYLGYDEKTGELTDPVEVTTGASDGNRVEILSGLQAGDTVWYKYYAASAISLLNGTSENT